MGMIAMTAPASETDDEIDSAIKRMTIRGRQFALLVLWDYLAGPDPLSLGNDPASRLISDSAGELDILNAGPSLFADAATILCAADRHEKFLQALNASQQDIVNRSIAALQAMGVQPSADLLMWQSHTQSTLAAELTRLAAFVTRH
jgi:hypothetical protein